MKTFDAVLRIVRILATAHTDAGSQWQSMRLKFDVGVALARGEPAWLARGWQGCTVTDSTHHVDVVEVIRYRHPVDFSEGGMFVMIGIPRASLAGADAGVAALMATFPPEQGHEVMQPE